MCGSTGYRGHAASALASLLIAGCSAPTTTASQIDAAEEKVSSIAASAKIQTAPIPAARRTILSDSDQIVLKLAADACKHRNFKQFFAAAVRSTEVRLLYFNTPVDTQAGKRTAKEYAFPIHMMDYSYVTASSAVRSSQEREYVHLEFNYAQDERVRVDWVRVDYGKNGNDEGETPEDDREYGPRGYLLFYPTTDCWTLAQDALAE